MPIYEYQCDSCGHYLEALQKISDAPLRDCPDCGRRSLRRLLSAPMFLLKGSGWYETDFKSDKETKRNLADRPEPEAPKAESAPEAKTEAKPEPKPEPKAEPGKEARKQTRSESASKRTSVAVSKPAKPRVPKRAGLRRAKRRL